MEAERRPERPRREGLLLGAFGWRRRQAHDDEGEYEVRGKPTAGQMPRRGQSLRRGPAMTRRGFAKAGAAALAAAAAAALPGCQSDFGDALFRNQRTIIDDAGRELSIPTANAIERVYYTSGLAQIYVFSLDPSLQGGTCSQYEEAQLKYLPEGTEDLVWMGSLSDGGEIDREELMRQEIDIVFSISGVGLTAANISDAESLQESTGIPVVLVDGSFECIGDAYRFVGDILGREERAEEIASYIEQVYAEVTEAVSVISDEERVSLYYAEGAFGLATEPNTSQHASCFEAARALNVAQVELNVDLGMSTTSLESVRAWDPEVIIAWDAEVLGGAAEIIKTDETWKGIRAVDTGRVYAMPAMPFAWCDRPPGVNRILGLQWVANMLYPDVYDVDMVEEAKKFYSTLYWYDLTDEEAVELLGNSYPPYRA